jgi:hypothetical protein
MNLPYFVFDRGPGILAAIVFAVLLFPFRNRLTRKGWLAVFLAALVLATFFGILVLFLLFSYLNGRIYFPFPFTEILPPTGTPDPYTIEERIHYDRNQLIAITISWGLILLWSWRMHERTAKPIHRENPRPKR